MPPPYQSFTITLDSEAQMLATDDWAYHIQRRDHCRLMSLFASDVLVGRHYEALAYKHGMLARQVLDASRSIDAHPRPLH